MKGNKKATCLDSYKITIQFDECNELIITVPTFRAYEKLISLIRSYYGEQSRKDPNFFSVRIFQNYKNLIRDISDIL